MKKLDLYVNKDGEKLRCGYTTGSCATGASKAAGEMLISGEKISEIKIETPAGIDLDLEVENAEIKKDYAIAAITKDSGDDPDTTEGIKIFAKVSFRDDKEINITGGEGIGKITKKGIYGEVGDYAINPTPKKMIRKELRKLDSEKGFNVKIFAPEGVEISKKTYNKNIGIVGGISIIGTKGIVYPMSEEAFIKTIYMEIDSIYKNEGTDITLVLTPGNYGVEFTKKYLENAEVVKISNYVGKALKYAYNKGFRDIFLIGHVGKFSKLSLGIFNTHNEVADTRMEAFCFYLALRGVETYHLKNILNHISGEEVVEYLIENNLQDVIYDMEKGAEKRIKKYLKDEDVKIKVKMYSLKRGTNFD